MFKITLNWTENLAPLVPLFKRPSNRESRETNLIPINSRMNFLVGNESPRGNEHCQRVALITCSWWPGHESKTSQSQAPLVPLHTVPTTKNANAPRCNQNPQRKPTPSGVTLILFMWAGNWTRNNTTIWIFMRLEGSGYTYRRAIFLKYGYFI
jgi:hypothetical protein